MYPTMLLIIAQCLLKTCWNECLTIRINPASLLASLKRKEMGTSEHHSNTHSDKQAADEALRRPSPAASRLACPLLCWPGLWAPPTPLA